MRCLALLVALALAVPAARAHAAPSMVPSAVVLGEAGATDRPASGGGAGRWILGEALALGVSSIGFAENGGNVKAGLFAAGGLLVLRDAFEARPVSPSRGHAVAIVGLAALALADMRMERADTARGTIVLVDVLALHAIAFGARDRSPR